MSLERIQLIRARLAAAFRIEILDVIDESHLHQGHPGAASGRGHFRLEIKSPDLEDLPRVKAHQKIYTALGDLMQTEIHALSIHLV